MIRYIAIEQDYMHEKIKAITGRFVSLYVYDTTITVQDGGPCRELTFIRNYTENYVRGVDGYEGGKALFDESSDVDAIARGKALLALQESGQVRDCEWSHMEYDAMTEYAGQEFTYEPVRTVDALPYTRFKGRGREATQEVAEYLHGNWQEPPLPWDKPPQPVRWQVLSAMAGGFENCWTDSLPDSEPIPTTFTTRKLAAAYLKDYLADCRESVRNGDSVDSPKRYDFKIERVGA